MGIHLSPEGERLVQHLIENFPPIQLVEMVKSGTIDAELLSNFGVRSEEWVACVQMIATSLAGDVTLKVKDAAATALNTGWESFLEELRRK